MQCWRENFFVVVQILYYFSRLKYDELFALDRAIKFYMQNTMNIWLCYT